ncbi:unnamed protein product [Heterosigma akashiwo]
MEDYEEKVVIKLSDGTVIRADWLRFRDDTWMIWEQSQELFDEFLEKLNGIHPKIKWEAVFEKNGQLPFLDVLVVRNEDGSFTIPRSTGNPHTLTGIPIGLPTIL